MSALSDQLTEQREVNAVPEQESPRETAAAEPGRQQPLLWSRVMQEARGRALLLARRAFPWRYY
jgi:hypothetical protein